MAGEFFVDIIRTHVGEPTTASDRAVLAVVDKCERMRAEAGIGMHLANDMEVVLIRALNAGIPWEHIDEFRRLAGA